MRWDTGMPSKVMMLMTLQPAAASVFCVGTVRAWQRRPIRAIRNRRGRASVRQDFGSQYAAQVLPPIARCGGLKLPDMGLEHLTEDRVRVRDGVIKPTGRKDQGGGFLIEPWMGRGTDPPDLRPCRALRRH
jgi:hypothetical protein